MEYLFLITGIGIGWFLDKRKAKREELKDKMEMIVKKIQRGKSIETINFRNGK